MCHCILPNNRSFSSRLASRLSLLSCLSISWFILFCSLASSDKQHAMITRWSRVVASIFGGGENGVWLVVVVAVAMVVEEVMEVMVVVGVMVDVVVILEVFCCGVSSWEKTWYSIVKEKSRKYFIFPFYLFNIFFCWVRDLFLFCSCLLTLSRWIVD